MQRHPPISWLGKKSVKRKKGELRDDFGNEEENDKGWEARWRWDCGKKNSRAKRRNSTKLKNGDLSPREIHMSAAGWDLSSPIRDTSAGLLAFCEWLIPILWSSVPDSPRGEMEWRTGQKEEETGFVIRENWVQILTYPVTHCVSQPVTWCLSLCCHLYDEDINSYPGALYEN